LNQEELPGLKVGLYPINGDLETIGLGDVLATEDDKNKLDFLNLIYVAFTRPVQALFAIGKNDKKDGFGNYLKTYLEKKMLWQEGVSTYRFGELAFKGEHKETNGGDGPGLQKMISTDWEDLIRIAPSEEVYWELLDSKPARTYGNLVHQLLSRVYLAEDVEAVVEQSRLGGLIDKTEAEKISLLLQEVVMHPALIPYFSSGVVVKNETELLDRNGIIHRPDRVVIRNGILCVIDYKTGEKAESHKKQINGYATAFEQLGYEGVQAKLVYLNEAVEVVEV